MRLTDKTKAILKDNSGETLVEVMVAFTLLSIMLLIFSQGIAFASRSEASAADMRNDADTAMIALQNDYPNNCTGWNPRPFSGGKIERSIYKVPVNGTEYTYVVYRAVP